MKILITTSKNHVEPRFDLSSEIVIASARDGQILGEPRIILLPGASSEEICALVIKEDVSVVICGGIEEVHYQYLTWKKVKVIDSIIGPYEQALNLALSDKLEAGAILPG
jgi:predicted Fe-Mo cluster-binding NifX family protein